MSIALDTQSSLHVYITIYGLVLSFVPFCIDASDTTASNELLQAPPRTRFPLMGREAGGTRHPRLKRTGPKLILSLNLGSQSSFFLFCKFFFCFVLGTYWFVHSSIYFLPRRPGLTGLPVQIRTLYGWAGWALQIYNPSEIGFLPFSFL